MIYFWLWHPKTPHQEEKEMLLTSNKSLAEYNLSQEPQVRPASSDLEVEGG